MFTVRRLVPVAAVVSLVVAFALGAGRLQAQQDEPTPSVGDLATRVKVLETRVTALEAQGTTTASSPSETSPGTPTGTPSSTTTAASPGSLVSVGGKYLFGNALPLLKPGQPGQLSIIAVGPYDGNELPLVVRNNTSKPVIRIKISATAYAPDGSLIAAGGDRGFSPNAVPPGGATIGYAYFDMAKLPANTTFKFEVSTDTEISPESENIRDFVVEQARPVDGRLVGILRNMTNTAIHGPISVNAECFDAAGTPTKHLSTFTDKNEAGPGDTVPFQVDLYGTNCSTFLVAGQGFIG